MDFEVFHLNVRHFPRFKYALKHSREPLERYYSIFNKYLERDENKSVPEKVHFFISNKEDQGKCLVEVKDIVNKSEEIEKHDVLKGVNLKYLLDFPEEKQDCISLLILPADARAELASLLSIISTQSRIVFITRNELEEKVLKETFRRDKYENVYVTTKADIAQDIGNLLEDIALKPLKEPCEHLDKLLHYDHESLIKSVVTVPTPSKERRDTIKTRQSLRLMKQKHAKTIRYDSSDHEQEMANLLFSKRLRLRNGNNKISLTRKPGKCNGGIIPGAYEKQEGHNYKYTKLVHVDKQKIESLLEEILALYDISNVPDSEKPNLTKHKNVKVTPELYQDLFAISPTIKRMGYRYSKFRIYALEINDEENKTKRNNEIEEVLHRNGIFDYEIAQCTKNVKPLMYVGASVEARSDTSISVRTRRSSSSVRKRGTLGCFVNLKQGQRRSRSKQCAILARHVAEHCNDLYHVSDGRDRKIGSIIPATCVKEHGSLDIAAAEMHEQPDVDGIRFKDSDRNLLPGRMHEYRGGDRIIRKGRKVYIWGATSNPGRGIITAPEIIIDGMKDPLIQIEDKDENEGTHFAREGDSGAIVCADDPEEKCVHALAMVVGSSSASQTKREYLTIPLSRGLAQIQDQTGKHVELC
ncbi:uncharacterized protein LOC128549845 [Mercenaria mercenaria]|uniref:uncharacterized protein LOC128549845 n=1 Tax=Mercenaria mercenaria TaxID=6596 RepID=UPI00234EA8ED|nr:uncharacterized protein LOC128549845 [Mercenaria mercenaria]